MWRAKSKHKKERPVLCLMKKLDSLVGPKLRLVLLADDGDIVVAKVPAIKIVMKALICRPKLKAVPPGSRRDKPRQSRSAIQVPFPDVPRAISGTLVNIRNRCHRFFQPKVVGDHSISICIHAGENVGSGWAAERRIGEGSADSN